MDYWNKKEERAEQARKHEAEMEKEHSGDIEWSLGHAICYGGPDEMPKQNPQDTKTPVIKLLKTDSVSAAFQEYDGGRIAILNFASYKNPGGMFLEGSGAQEEALCHASTLYNVLRTFDKKYYAWNRQNLNHALYTNRAIYTPYILFFRYCMDSPKVKQVKQYFDVLTCAAPNYGTAHRFQNVSREENTEVLRSRIQFIKDIAEDWNVKCLILGAFGCGVFKQDAEEVASVFKEVFATTSISNLVFPIPDEKNLSKFEKVFGPR